ncbi:hypothetical protein [Thalassotalea ganghwensis]
MVDIFTTALTKVVTAKLEPKGLRVKALAKEPRIKPLSEDVNHLEEHDRYYFLKDNTDQHTKQQQQKQKQHQEGDKDITSSENVIEPSEDVIIHKDEILHPKDKSEENDDDDIKHFDIFV